MAKLLAVLSKALRFEIPEYSIFQLFLFRIVLQVFALLFACRAFSTRLRQSQNPLHLQPGMLYRFLDLLDETPTITRLSVHRMGG